MGRKDTITKEFMRSPAIFADAFNKYLYHGRQAIKPEALAELDAAELSVPYGAADAGVPVQKYWDVLKTVMSDGSIAYCILGVENQGGIHYAAPVKNGLYDFMQLARQVTEAASSHKRERKKGAGTQGCKPSGDEFLSGFYKTDKLLPVVTLVVFFSPDGWDGPLTLREMYSPADSAVMQCVPDYRVNLLAPGSMPDEEIYEFRSSLREVFLYIKYSKDKKKLLEMTQADRNFRSLDRRAADVINVTTNSNLKYPEGQEVVDMCVAIEEMRMESKAGGIKEGLREGKLEGSVETYQEFGLSLQDTVQRVAGKFNLSLQEALEQVNKCWK